LPGEPVEQGRFADIGAPDDGDRQSHGRALAPDQR
jgi:hypothetical protein